MFFKCPDISLSYDFVSDDFKCPQMSPNVIKKLQMSSNFFKMSSNVFKCSQIASNVLKCLQMYSNVAEISLSYDSCSNFKSNLKIVNSRMCKKRLVTAKLTRRKNVCHLWITHRAAGLMKFSHKLQVRALEFAYFFSIGNYFYRLLG